MSATAQPAHGATDEHTATRPATGWLLVAVMVLAVVVLFLAITAAAAPDPGQTAIVPIPSIAAVIETIALAIVVELLRRGIRKLGDLSDKCDKIDGRLTAFEAEITTAVGGYGGRGGLLDRVENLEEAVFSQPPAAPPADYRYPRSTSSQRSSDERAT